MCLTLERLEASETREACPGQKGRASSWRRQGACWVIWWRTVGERTGDSQWLDYKKIKVGFTKECLSINIKHRKSSPLQRIVVRNLWEIDLPLPTQGQRLLLTKRKFCFTNRRKFSETRILNEIWHPEDTWCWGEYIFPLMRYVLIGYRTRNLKWLNAH